MGINESQNVSQNGQVNYYENLKNLNKLSQRQLDRLDALDGNKDGNITDKGIFDLAQSILNGTKVPQEINPNYTQEVIDIMRNIDVTQVMTELKATPVVGVAPETLQSGLGFSDNQMDALLKLSQRYNNNPDVIDKGVAAIAITIARSQPTPQGAPEELCNEIRSILTNIQPVESNFGL